MTSSPLSRIASERPAYVALAAVLVLGILSQLTHHLGRPIDSLGWDEAMHAEGPAARMALGLSAGEVGEAFQAVLDCDRYPPAFPMFLAAGQALFGVSESVARGLAYGLWLVLGMLGLVRVGLALARATARPDEPPPLELVLLLPAASLLSPLVWRYAPTLFLEVPFLVVSSHVLASWIERSGDGARIRTGKELLLGLGLVVAFFTKFNYAALLFMALFADALITLRGARRRGVLAAELRRMSLRAAPLVVALLWWFGWPLPYSLAAGADHRLAFSEFLAGNRNVEPLPRPWRLMDWYTGVAIHPSMLFVWVLAGLSTLPLVVLPAGRVLWLLLAGTVLPVWFHPFHLDRFLIPGLLPIWALSSLGLQRILAARHAWQARLGLALFAGLFAVAGALAWRYPNHVFADRLRLLPEDSGARERLIHAIDEQRSLFGTVPTAGLPRETHDALLDLIVQGVGPEDRVAWFGMSSEVSPGALHLGLLARGGSSLRFREDAHRQMDVTPTPGFPLPALDPAGTRDWLDAATSRFDVVLTTTPTDLKDRPRPGLYDGFVVPLVSDLGFTATELGRVEVPRPDGSSMSVAVLALRRP